MNSSTVAGRCSAPNHLKGWGKLVPSCGWRYGRNYLGERTSKRRALVIGRAGPVLWGGRGGKGRKLVAQLVRWCGGENFIEILNVIVIEGQQSGLPGSEIPAVTILAKDGDVQASVPNAFDMSWSNCTLRRYVKA